MGGIASWISQRGGKCPRWLNDGPCLPALRRADRGLRWQWHVQLLSYAIKCKKSPGQINWWVGLSRMNDVSRIGWYFYHLISHFAWSIRGFYIRWSHTSIRMKWRFSTRSKSSLFASYGKFYVFIMTGFPHVKFAPPPQKIFRDEIFNWSLAFRFPATLP